VQNKAYGLAKSYYKRASQISLVAGNAHNQLAVIALYQSNILATLYHYYRSLLAKQPFGGVKENLEALLSKAYRTDRSPTKEETGKESRKFLASFIRSQAALYLEP